MDIIVQKIDEVAAFPTGVTIDSLFNAISTTSNEHPGFLTFVLNNFEIPIHHLYDILNHSSSISDHLDNNPGDDIRYATLAVLGYD